MAGIWIYAENREQTLELLNIGRRLAVKMGTILSALLAGNHDAAPDYIAHGADEVLLLPPLAPDQSHEAYLPVIVDAGLGSPSDACECMEMGCAAVLVNTAIAIARDPVAMARAFKDAVIAGRTAYLAGLVLSQSEASASSPLTGCLRNETR